MSRIDQHCGYQELTEKQRRFSSYLWIIGIFLLCLGLTFISLNLKLTKEPLPLKHPNLTLSQPDSDALPSGFLIGCATSSYQIEGAWNSDGKGESIWDHLAHTQPDFFYNHQNADVTCDSYHKYKEDVRNLKYIGLTHYRFSISWPRVLPTGYSNNISQAGVNYYHKLIDELLLNHIIPVVTLYHWDLPQPLQELGGWANPLMADYFMEYARVIFKEFGDKVKWWITLNEPYHIVMGYGDTTDAPALNQHGVADYLAAHTLLRAHSKVYHLYDKMFRNLQNGKIGITLSAMFAIPLTNSTEDKTAAVRSMEFDIGIFAHPIFSKEGNYPTIVRELVDYNSNKEGRTTSRLPKLSEKDVQKLQGSADFFGLNHYYSQYATSGLDGPDPSWLRDSKTVLSANSSWKEGAPGFYVVPTGFRGILNFIRNQYDNPLVFITENGLASPKLEDFERIQFYHDYLMEMLKAIYEDDCNVIGYTAWSCIDNFEWYLGYSQRFGLYHVDFNSTNRTRTKKLSVDYFKQLITTNKIPKVPSAKNL